MIIEKKRVRSLKYLKYLKDGQTVRFGVSALERFSKKLRSIGFTENLQVGESVLPNTKMGAVSRRNSEGKIIIHRDQPKETAYRTVEWSWKQWAGRGETVEVSDFRDVPYERYPRTHIPPFCIELTIADKDGVKYIVTPAFTYSEENEELLIHAINLILELFGECEVLDEDLQSLIVPELIRLNWEVLPPGKRPWKKLREEIDPFIQNAKKGNQSVVLHRIEQIKDYDPDFIAIGKAGFRGYIILGFKSKDTYVLESIYTNNATYVFGNNWEELSRLTKAEIIWGNLQKARIIHSKGWSEQIQELLK